MSDTENLEWVTEEQIQVLEVSAWERDWPLFLRRRLDARSSGWEYTPGDELRAWLDDAIDVIGLGWVTLDQQSQLNELWETYGDWREWLPDTLDERWTERWIESSPSELAADLDALLPELILPAGVAVHTDEYGRSWTWDEDRQEWIAEDGSTAQTGEDAQPLAPAAEAEPLTPEVVSDKVVSQIGAPALVELAMKNPELTAGMPQEQLTALLSEVMAERLAATTQ